MNQETRSYFRRREQVERAAAKGAACPQARRVHQELAQNYAALVRQQSEVAHSEPPAARRRLTIVTQPSS